MDKKETAKMEALDVDGVATLLQQWEMAEFVEFVREKQLDGRKLLEATEGIVKLWRPKANAKKLMAFIDDLNINPKKYLELKEEDKIKTTNAIEAQYQTVSVKRLKVQNLTSTTFSGVEEILKKIVPAKSFLYRHQNTKFEKAATSYVPMDAGATKKSRRFFRLSYDYPNFDIKNLRFSKTENFNDRGYYSIKTEHRQYAQKTYKKPESRKYNSLTAVEELNDKYPEEHFYEDLCYTDIEKEIAKDVKDPNTTQKSVATVKPCMVKIQELFSSLKLPFSKKTHEIIEGDISKEKEKDIEEYKGLEEVEDVKVEKPEAKELEGHIYENTDNLANMYDSVHVKTHDVELGKQLPVEEYLEPVQLSKDYCDVSLRQKDDSILGYIMSLFENRFGIWRETNDATQSDDSSEKEPAQDAIDHRKWLEERKPRKTNMADRPLPVPVENEPYYMSIDRGEAENLLKGQPDGTFVLRPSSQPNHAYTLTVSCSNAVHNVGVRRRPDGRLALGFARRGERSFASVTSLLRHHRRRRLLLVAGGTVCGATTLNETPQYYQTPSSLPLTSS